MDLNHIFPDEDFCIYKDFPFDKLILLSIVDNAPANIPIKYTCTFLWIAQNYSFYLKNFDKLIYGRIFYNKFKNITSIDLFCNYSKMQDNSVVCFLKLYVHGINENDPESEYPSFLLDLYSPYILKSTKITVLIVLNILNDLLTIFGLYKHPIQNHNHFILFDDLSPNQNIIDLPDFIYINSILNELKNSIQHPSPYMINDLQKAIYLCSNGNAQNLSNLQTLFENDVGLLKSLIPKIIDLALDLPNRINKSIPLLKQGSKSSISLSDEQCASILANAFFCTFPNRTLQTNPEKMPFINFDCLYNDTYSLVKVEKLKCILYYFKCITSKKSDTKRIITFSRICNTDEKLNNLEKYLKESKLNLVVPKICPEGSIEDHKLALQVDFA
ncbi:unnamed protein product, partial [Brachionus calyciflorus]